MSNITNIELLEKVVQEYATILESLQNKYSKLVKITKYSQPWWNKECNIKLNFYHISKFVADQKEFKKAIKNTKRLFFDKKIQEIASKNKKPQDLINWIKK